MMINLTLRRALVGSIFVLTVFGGYEIWSSKFSEPVNEVDAEVRTASSETQLGPQPDTPFPMEPEKVVDGQLKTADGIFENSSPLSLKETEAQRFREFREAESALEASYVIDSLRNEGNDIAANDLEMLLRSTCYAIQKGIGVPNEGSQWVLDRLELYCSNYDTTLTPNAHYERMAGVNPATELYYQELDRVLQNLSVEESAEELLRYMANSSTYSEFDAAFHKLNSLRMQYGNERVDFGQDSDLRGQNLDEVFIYSRILTECRLFGGCSPTGIALANFCYSAGNCVEGWSMEEYLYNNLSPIQFTQLNQVVDNILAKRNP